MSQSQVPVTVEQATYAVGQAIVGLITSIKSVSGSNFNAGQALPLILAQNLQALTQAISQAEQIPSDSKEDVGAFINTWVVVALQIMNLFVK